MDITQHYSWTHEFTSTTYSVADGWSMAITLVGQGSTFTHNYTGEGYCWKLTVAAADADYTPGLYTYLIKASKGADVFIVSTNTVEVKPDPVDAAPDADLRSANQRILGALRAKIEGRVTADTEELEIAGHRIRNIPFEQLVKYEAVYAQRVAAEKRGGLRTFITYQKLSLS